MEALNTTDYIPVLSHSPAKCCIYTGEKEIEKAVRFVELHQFHNMIS